VSRIGAEATIQLAADLSLPLDVATDTLGILAIKDGGKTYAAMLLVEQLVKARLPVVAIDPVGVFWGLRVAGKGPGLPIVILGGEHGDVPIEPGAGRAVADFVVAERQSVVLDFRGFHTKAEQMRFSLDFLTRLYERNRDVLHVVIDEADELAPQKPFGEETRVLRAVEVLVRRGRARGLGCTLITQRPAVLNKNVLTQCSTLIVGRMMAPQDRKAVEAWVEAHGTESDKKQMMGSLATLPKFDKWVWAPARSVFRRVRIDERTTFDSSATPKVGIKRAEPKGLAEVDLASLRDRLAETIERAKADDPVALKKRVAELQAQLKKDAAPRAANALTTPNQVVVERMPEGLVEKLSELSKLARQLVETAEKAVKSGSDALRQLEQRTLSAKRELADAEHLVSLAKEALKVSADVSARSPRTRGNAKPVDTKAVAGAVSPAPLPPSRPARVAVVENVLSVENAMPTNGEVKLSSGEKRILGRLKMASDGLTSMQLGIATGYTWDGGGFRNMLSHMRTLGLIEGSNSDVMRLTGRGIAVALTQGDMHLNGGADLVAEWCGQLGKAERLILSCVWEDGPTPVDVEVVAGKTSYESTGGGFRNALGKLRSLGLIEGKKALAIHPIFHSTVS